MELDEYTLAGSRGTQLDFRYACKQRFFCLIDDWMRVGGNLGWNKDHVAAIILEILGDVRDAWQNAIIRRDEQREALQPHVEDIDGQELPTGQTS